jgi:hypothetical protein
MRHYGQTSILAVGLSLGIAAPLWTPLVAQQPPPLEPLITRATDYVEDFIEGFSHVVAEEQYVQNRLEVRMEGSRGTFIGTPQITETRTIKSDWLLVLPRGAEHWYVFRDVFEVDGRPVRDRDGRLAKLFLDSGDTNGAIRSADEIAAEGNRFHFSEAGTYDQPVFALGLLQRAYRTRLRFTLNGQDKAAGPNIWVVKFDETARPTIIRGANGENVIAQGRFWIDAASGRVVQTELTATALGVQSTVTTTFALDRGLGIYVPTGMRTRFRRGVMGRELQGTATYGGFRRFDVRTEERLPQ